MRTTQYCYGCRDDRYNHPGLCERPGIDAPVTSSHCWHLAAAKLIAGYAISTSAPMGNKAAYRKVKRPNCWSGNGTVLLTKEQFLAHTR